MDIEKLKNTMNLKDFNRFIDYKTLGLDETKFNRYTVELNDKEKRFLRKHLSVHISEFRKKRNSIILDPVKVEKAQKTYDYHKNNFERLSIDEKRLFMLEKYLLEERSEHIYFAVLYARGYSDLKGELKELLINFLETGEKIDLCKGIISLNRIMDETNVGYHSALGIFELLDNEGSDIIREYRRGYPDFLKGVDPETFDKYTFTILDKKIIKEIKQEVKSRKELIANVKEILETLEVHKFKMLSFRETKKKELIENGFSFTEGFDESMDSVINEYIKEVDKHIINFTEVMDYIIDDITFEEYLSFIRKGEYYSYFPYSKIYLVPNLYCELERMFSLDKFREKAKR